ncbi:DUF5983 family protein [Paenibacillus enshidis]
MPVIHSTENLPEDLKQIFTLAEAQECEYIMLDVSGTVYEQIPIFERV